MKIINTQDYLVEGLNLTKSSDKYFNCEEEKLDTALQLKILWQTQGDNENFGVLQLIKLIVILQLELHKQFKKTSNIIKPLLLQEHQLLEELKEEIKYDKSEFFI